MLKEDANKENSSSQQMDVTEFTEEFGKPTRKRVLMTKSSESQ
jgi:hypothetical protein